MTVGITLESDAATRPRLDLYTCDMYDASEWTSIRVGSCQGGRQRSEARRHFHEATTVFSDERAILLDDPDHSDDEDRFLLVGSSAHLRTLVVSHAYRASEDVIRLISARKATKRERRDYARGWNP